MVLLTHYLMKLFDYFCVQFEMLSVPLFWNPPFLFFNFSPCRSLFSFVPYHIYILYNFASITLSVISVSFSSLLRQISTTWIYFLWTQEFSSQVYTATFYAKCTSFIIPFLFGKFIHFTSSPWIPHCLMSPQYTYLYAQELIG